MTAIVTGSVARIQIMHSRGEIGLGRAREEVPMIGHQYPREYAPSASKGHALEKLEPGFTINVIPHDVPPFSTAGSNVIQIVFQFDAQWPSHNHT